MECDICSRKDVAQVGMHCTVCARTAIYGLRLEAARLLLEKESLSAKIEKSTSDAVPSNTSDDLKASSKRWKSELRKTHSLAITERIEEQKVHSTSAKEEISKLREEIGRRRAHIAQRKKDLETIEEEASSRQHTLTDKLKDIGKKGLRSFDSININSIETRAFLCREAAHLLGMKHQRVRKAGQVRQRFVLAGHVISDLRLISNKRCTEVSALLAAVSRLLVLVAFYLGVRLPAEITLPHRDYPFTTVNTPGTSYLSTKVPFPGSGSNVSVPPSPSSSKHETKNIPKPRPLFIGSYNTDELVYQAAKRDRAAFKYFVEGLSLLVWDIAWLSHTQGFGAGTASWEEACDIGRSLWHLLFTQQLPTLPKTMSNKEVRYRQRGTEGEPSSVSPSPKLTGGRLGEYSHASSHTFLGSATGTEQRRPMKLGTHMMIFDPLRKTLEMEIKNADWELVGEEEYDDGEERFETHNAVLVPVGVLDSKHYDEARNIVTPKATVHNAEEPPNGVRAKGTSGWTKVKNRESPA